MKYTVWTEWAKKGDKVGTQLCKGLLSGAGVSVYASPSYDWWQMEEIRLGLENGIDVSIYADAKYAWGQMWQIRWGIEAGVDVSQYADVKYRWPQMEQIRNRLERDAYAQEKHK